MYYHGGQKYITKHHQFHFFIRLGQLWSPCTQEFSLDLNQKKIDHSHLPLQECDKLLLPSAFGKKSSFRLLDFTLKNMSWKYLNGKICKKHTYRQVTFQRFLRLQFLTKIWQVCVRSWFWNFLLLKKFITIPRQLMSETCFRKGNRLYCKNQNTENLLKIQSKSWTFLDFYFFFVRFVYLCIIFQKNCDLDKNDACQIYLKIYDR